MAGFRIQFRQLAYNQPNVVDLLVGEPVFDPATRRFGIGIGGELATWYPGSDASGNLVFDTDQGMISSNGNYSLKFTATGLTWNAFGITVLETRQDQGIAVSDRIVWRDRDGNNIVALGHEHARSLVAMLFNIKAILRKIILGTATIGDVNAIFDDTLLPSLAGLDPTFPEAPGL